MTIHFPGESAEYRTARDNLLKLEIDARRAVTAAADARRALPPGGVVPTDYVFEALGENGETKRTKLSELFGTKDTLVIYSYMFGPEKKEPCNMCTPILDGFDGIEEHVSQRFSLVIVAESPVARLHAYAKERGWKRLNIISTAGNTYNRDYFGKTPDKGHDTTMLNVFHRDGNEIRHFWGAEMVYAPTDPGQDIRAMDLLSPIFNLFDVTPEGRGNFYTKLHY